MRMRYRKGEAEVGDHATGSQKVTIPNCEDGSTKLGTTLELLKWKAETGLSDKGFKKLLKIMKSKFPKVTNCPRLRTKQRRLSAL